MGCVGCEKLQRDFVARTFALIARVQYVLEQVSGSYKMIPNATKHCETDRNISLGSNRVDWVCSLWKNPTWLRGTNFCIVLYRVWCSYEIIPNAPKYCETDRNISLGSARVDWIRSLRKIPTWLRGPNFCINCTSSPNFAPTFMQLRNDPKCTQTLWNAPKHEIRVQWGGSGAFVASNSDMTSWNKLLH